MSATVAIASVALGTNTFGGTSDAQDVIATADLRDANGVEVGEVRFQMRGRRVLGEVEAALPGDSSRFHGFHLHANSDRANGAGCIGPAFTSADGHWNPTGAGHGNHAGDLPPLILGPDGRSRAEFDAWHFGPDNLANIPTRYTTAGAPGPDAPTLAAGDAGARYACGVIKASGR